MAAMSDADRAKAARIYARKTYSGNVCNVSHADILAAVGAVDDAFESVPTSLPSQLSSLAVNLNQVLPDPYKTTATNAQKAALLAVTVGVKYGYITSGGN